MSLKNNPNWIRGNQMLNKNINSPDDLIRMWRMYGSYSFGAPPIENTAFPWWS